MGGLLAVKLVLRLGKFQLEICETNQTLPSHLHI